MKVHRAYKVRLYPNKIQEEKMSKIIDASRFVYNHYLENRKNHYLESKTTLKYSAMARDLTVRRKEIDSLSKIQAEPLHQSLRRLDKSYNAFFKKTSNFPKFKSRFEGKQSFQKHKDWRVRDNKIQIQSDLIVKYRGFIDEKAELGTLVIIREGTKWYASIMAKVELETPKKYSDPIGIDMGISTLATLSTGEKLDNIRSQEQLQSKLKVAQQNLARCQKGSKRRESAKEKVARIYKKIANVRANHNNQLTRQIVNTNPSLIAVEDLNVAGMVKNHKLARVLVDASMRDFLTKLKCKQEWNGGEYVEIDRFFPSSKTCHNCFFIADSMPLSEREWTCPQCGIEHDRDVNASKVILQQGLAYSSRGDLERVSVRRESPLSVKRHQA